MSNRLYRLRMFVVEDNPSFQEIYDEIWSSEFDITAVSTKSDAFRILGENTFDVALIDMRLDANDRTNTEGLDVAQFIHDLGMPTAVILISGYLSGHPTAVPETEARLKKLNLFKVLEKNAQEDLGLLRDTVSAAIASRHTQT